MTTNCLQDAFVEGAKLINLATHRSKIGRILRINKLNSSPYTSVANCNIFCSYFLQSQTG
jgi:hypothetical protein